MTSGKKKRMSMLDSLAAAGAPSPAPQADAGDTTAQLRMKQSLDKSELPAPPQSKGKALKLCEIAAALVVAGELSLSGAARVDKKTRTNEWVDAHERLGRNR